MTCATHHSQGPTKSHHKLRMKSQDKEEIENEKRKGREEWVTIIQDEKPREQIFTTCAGGIQMSLLVPVSGAASLLAGTKHLFAGDAVHSPKYLLPRDELTDRLHSKALIQCENLEDFALLFEATKNPYIREFAIKHGSLQNIDLRLP